MTSISDAETTRDAFLGGRLHLLQPRRGYRAGVDPLLLAASVTARPGQSVLELGCGVGTALFALAVRVGDLSLTGLELQPAYADLARRNAVANGVAADIHTADLADLPPGIRRRRYDHVLANPPYHAAGSGTAPRLGDRAIAHRERMPLADWIAAGAKRLAPRGTMSVIQRADRLADLLAAMRVATGSLIIRPIQPRVARDASLVIVHGTKGGRAAPRLSAPLIMHQSVFHRRDGDDYTDDVRAVLREAAALPGNP